MFPIAHVYGGHFTMQTQFIKPKIGQSKSSSYNKIITKDIQFCWSHYQRYSLNPKFLIQFLNYRQEVPECPADREPLDPEKVMLQCN